MILVTGATGFIGSNLVEHLLARPLPVRALVRPGSPQEYLRRRGVEVVEGDVTDPGSLPAACEGVQAVVHLVGLLVEPPGQTFESVVAEGTRSLAAAAAEAGVRRFVYVSAVGADRNGPSRYQRTKAMAEEAVVELSPEPVIVRPSLVYGPGDEFIRMMTGGPLPLPGGGRVRIQPLYVADLVQVLADCTQRDDVAGRVFEIGGPDACTLREVVDRIDQITGRGGRWMHPGVPLALAEAGAAVFEVLRGPMRKLGQTPPVTRDQLVLLMQDNVCDNREVLRTFGLTLTPLEQGLKTVLKPRAAA